MNTDPLPTTIKLIIKSCNKSKMLNCWEIFYIQSFHQKKKKNKFVAEQNVYDYKILYFIAQTDSAEMAWNYTKKTAAFTQD